MQLWLIDCDNNYLRTESSQTIHRSWFATRAQRRRTFENRRMMCDTIELKEGRRTDGYVSFCS